MTFDHLGIVVPDLDVGYEKLSALVHPVSWTRRFDDSNLSVSVRFAKDSSGIIYELIAPLGDASPVTRAVRSRTNLLNHIAYRTESLESCVRHLRRSGAVPVARAAPAIAFGGARVQFLMCPLNFLIELIEIDHSAHEFV